MPRLGYKPVLIGVFVCCTTSHAEECLTITPETANRLAEYVHAKFNFPPSTQIVLATSEAVDNTCYRRIHFRSQGSGRQDIAFFLSPDQRFLSRELMDLTLNPKEQQRQEQHQLAVELTKGVFPMRGSPEAPVTVTIFSDFQCPYCRQEATNLNGTNLADLKVRLVFRNLPLPMHPWARAAAERAACVQTQSNDAFWEIHDYLFRNQPEVSSGNLDEIIESVISKRPDIDLVVYRQCVKNHETSVRIDQDLAFAKAHNISGTPTLFINGLRHDGVAKPDELRALILHEGAEAAAVTH